MNTPIGWVQWVEWVGVGRLVLSAASVVVIVGGLWWLLRAPPVPSEQRLPVAAASSSSPPATLPVDATTQPIDDQATESTQALIVVHVAGAVMVPGVYELGPDARVIDAIEQAGGLGDEAEDSAINLAAPLVDGARVYIPAEGETPDGASPQPGVEQPPLVQPPSGAAGSGEKASNEPININAASAAELEELPGVGPATASAIVDDRERNGPFQTVEELERVPGIGPAKLAALRDLVVT